MVKGTGRLVGVFAAVLGVGACGNVTSKTDGGGDGGLTAAQACATLAQAECSKRDSCSNGTSITRVYGEISVCLTRAALECTTRLAAPNTGASPQTVSRCAASYATLSCNDFFDDKVLADCMPAGPGANGQHCAFNGQCATAYCSGTANALCGTCAAQPAAGDSCAGSFCGPGQDLRGDYDNVRGRSDSEWVVRHERSVRQRAVLRRHLVDEQPGEMRGLARHRRRGMRRWHDAGVQRLAGACLRRRVRQQDMHVDQLRQ